MHGGLHPDDSRATFSFGWPEVGIEHWQMTEVAIEKSIRERCAKEDGRQPSTADLFTALKAVTSM